MKTLAIRLDDELHAQLSVLAQLSGTSLTDEIRQALEAHLKATRDNPELTERAKAVSEEIEHEAQARQAAITTLFGAAEQPKAAKASSKRPQPTRTPPRTAEAVLGHEALRLRGRWAGALGRSAASQVRATGPRPITRKRRKEVSMHEGRIRRAPRTTSDRSTSPTVGDDGGLRGDWMETAEYIAHIEERHRSLVVRNRQSHSSTARDGDDIPAGLLSWWET